MIQAMSSRPFRVLAAGLTIVSLGVAASCGGDDGDAEPDASIVLTDPTVTPFSLITNDQAIAMMAADDSVVLVDVRTPAEYAQGHIADAVNVDFEGADFASAIGELPADGRYIVYCRSGNRSAQALIAMRDAGFSDVYDMGGLQAWMANGHPIVTT